MNLYVALVVVALFALGGRTTIPDEVLVTINSLEILGIIYLAIAVSKLRSEIARLQGLREGEREQKGRPE